MEYFSLFWNKYGDWLLAIHFKLISIGNGLRTPSSPTPPLSSLSQLAVGKFRQMNEVLFDTMKDVSVFVRKETLMGTRILLLVPEPIGSLICERRTARVPKSSGFTSFFLYFFYFIFLFWARGKTSATFINLMGSGWWTKWLDPPLGLGTFFRCCCCCFDGALRSAAKMHSEFLFIFVNQRKYEFYGFFFWRRMYVFLCVDIILN